MLQGDVSSLRRCKMRQAGTAAPVLVDIGDQGVERLVGGQPMTEPRKGSIEYKRVAPAGVGGCEKRSQRPSFRDTELHRAVDAHSIHNNANVIHSLVHSR